VKTRHRTRWISVPMQVCFEESEMEVLVRDGRSRRDETRRETREILMPVFRLPDGTEFTGRRAGEALRAKIIRAAEEAKKESA